MHRAGAALLLLLMGLSPLFAQDGSDDPSIEIDWGDYTSDLYTRGDQTVALSIGTVFPVVFLNNGNVIYPFTPPVGGTGSITYSYFLTSNIFVGGEIRGLFLFSTAGDTLFVPQIGARAGYQFNVWKLEFPLSVSIGMAWHNFLNMTYYGLYIMGSAAGYYRANQDWSFGLNINWGWLPEWTSDKSKNIDGNILDILISARYHF